MAEIKMTAAELPKAVGNLFSLNSYSVRYSVHVHGAEVDIVAKSRTDQFAPTIYIEVTIEFVNTTKYGKDLTKFSLVREKDPSCVCICVSSVGFTPDVVERARQTRITTLTYAELFRSFEKFSPYVDRILQSKELGEFAATYEEPFFNDRHGEVGATAWLTRWKTSPALTSPWLIILGEYGTGKTSLTKVLQYRWLRAYEADAANPIPFLIELRHFSRQFDAKSLVHYFLDHNDLAHIPIDFVFFLVRQGRILLLLDGYDEMAQFLNARERRACLSALAELSGEGARGFMTSRPNFFTETEELRVFEALYAGLQEKNYYLGASDRSYLDAEKQVDVLVEKYVLNRYERYLRDLTIEQTEALVRRKLQHDSEGQEVVLSLLRRVFRTESDGRRQALSGKPVIIAYLLELIDELKQKRPEAEDLTEWQIYRMIVDRLMLRDLQRSPTLPTTRRRRCLQRLALLLSQRDPGAAQEEHFYDIIENEFRADLRLMDSEEKRHKREELFEDLRGSATLTRTETGGKGGWVFSHNSLREYLAAEYYVETLNIKAPIEALVTISSAMRQFVASLPKAEFERSFKSLGEIWHMRHTRATLGAYLTLLWDGIVTLLMTQSASLSDLSEGREDRPIALDALKTAHIDFLGKHFPSGKLSINGANSEFAEVAFRDIDLSGSDFTGATFDAAIFENCVLKNATFAQALLFECDMTGTEVSEANFSGLDSASSLLLRREGQPILRLTGEAAVGYLAFHGARTDAVPDYYRFQHHPKFPIVMKICERLAEQRNSQLRGLTQRGQAHVDPAFARQFVRHLKGRGLVDIDQHDLVSATAEGRNAFSALMLQNLPPAIRDFLG